MFKTKYTNKEITFLLKNTPKLKKYLTKKLHKVPQSKIDKRAQKLIDKFLRYKISRKAQDKLNLARLKSKKQYKSNSYFVITELGEDEKDFYEKESLAEVTENNWNFQKKSYVEDSIRQIEFRLKKELGEEKGELYKDTLEKEREKIETNSIKRYGDKYESLFLYGSWCRWVNEIDRIEYGTLVSVESFYLDVVSELTRELLDKVIPNILLTSSEKIEGKKMYTMDFETRAMGREEEYDSLNKKTYAFNEKFVKDTLGGVIKGLSGCVFTKTSGMAKDITTEVIIPDLGTAKMLKTKTIMAEIRKLEQPFGVLDQRIDKVLEECGLEKLFLKMYEENKK